MTPEGTDRGRLRAQDLLILGGDGELEETLPNKPPSDCGLHLEILRACGVRSVIHTASVWNLLIADSAAEIGGLQLEGFYALGGISQGASSLWIPSVPFSSDAEKQKLLVHEALRRQASAAALLVRGVGLISWGRDFEEAKRRTEILEMLIETAARSRFSVYRTPSIKHGQTAVAKSDRPQLRLVV
jgi:ribulose-5-phosphate 4-epimerase/fuculose-1-phosphate aldolase